MQALFDSIPLPCYNAAHMEYPCGDGAQMLLYTDFDTAKTNAYLDVLLSVGFTLIDRYTIP